MSRMTDAIDKISICAEQKQYKSLHFLEKVESIKAKTKLRFSSQEIDNIVKEYPFKLPVEFYELYQRGNGINLPIGLNRNYNYFSNYFAYLGQFTTWFPLEEAIDLYQNLANSYIKNGKLDSNIFPIFNNEICTYVVRGNKKQQSTSPIFAINEALETYQVCPTVSNLMLAHLETIEQSDVNGRRNEENIDAIAEKHEIAEPWLIS